MRKSYGKGLANHIGPESCGINGNNGIETLTGVSTGWVLSPEMKIISSVDGFQEHGKQHFIDRYGKEYEDSAGRRPHACTETSCAGIGRPCI
jgi:hypothetical protein